MSGQTTKGVDLNDDDQRSEETIFSAALQLASAAERAAYLHAACAGDGDLRRRVEALLEAKRGLGEFMENLPAGGAAVGQRPLFVCGSSPTPLREYSCV